MSQGHVLTAPKVAIKRPRSPSSECSTNSSTASNEHPRQKRICRVRECPEQARFRQKWLNRRALRTSQSTTKLDLSAYHDNKAVTKHTVITINESPRLKSRSGQVSKTPALTILVPQQLARSLCYGVMRPELTRKKSGSCPSTVLKARNGRLVPRDIPIQEESRCNEVTESNSTVPCKLSTDHNSALSAKHSKPIEGNGQGALGSSTRSRSRHGQGPIDQWLEELPQSQEGYAAMDRVPVAAPEEDSPQSSNLVSPLDQCLLCSPNENDSHFFFFKSLGSPLTKPMSKLLGHKSNGVALGEKSKAYPCNYLPCKMKFSSVEDLLEHQRHHRAGMVWSAPCGHSFYDRDRWLLHLSTSLLVT